MHGAYVCRHSATAVDTADVFNASRVLGAPARQDEHGAAVLAVRERSPGTVVATGGTEWAWGPAGGDPAVERITLNLFEELAV